MGTILSAQEQFELDNEDCVKLTYFTHKESGQKYIRMTLSHTWNCIWIVGIGHSTRKQYTLNEMLPSGDIACVMGKTDRYSSSLDLSKFPDKTIYRIENQDSR